MSGTRCKDVNWTVSRDDNGYASYEGAQLAVLMDIRDELKLMNIRMQCPDFISIPRFLMQIRRNTTKRRRKKP